MFTLHRACVAESARRTSSASLIRRHLTARGSWAFGPALRSAPAVIAAVQKPLELGGRERLCRRAGAAGSLCRVQGELPGCVLQSEVLLAMPKLSHSRSSRSRGPWADDSELHGGTNHSPGESICARSTPSCGLRARSQLGGCCRVPRAQGRANMAGGDVAVELVGWCA